MGQRFTSDGLRFMPDGGLELLGRIPPGRTITLRANDIVRVQLVRGQQQQEMDLDADKPAEPEAQAEPEPAAAEAEPAAAEQATSERWRRRNRPVSERNRLYYEVYCELEKGRGAAAVISQRLGLNHENPLHQIKIKLVSHALSWLEKKRLAKKEGHMGGAYEVSAPFPVELRPEPAPAPESEADGRG